MNMHYLHSINIHHIDCYCIKRIFCCFPTMPLLIFIYSMMWQVICKYEPFWQEVSVVSLILRCPLRPLDILFLFSTNLWRTWTFFLEDSFSSNCAFWRNIYVLWLRGGESTMYILKKIHFSVKRFLRLYQRKFVLDLQFFFCCIPNLTQRVLERGGADWILL